MSATAQPALSPPKLILIVDDTPINLGVISGALKDFYNGNLLVKRYDVDILCGYVMKSFQREPERHIYERICAEHSAVCSQWTCY